MSNGKEPKAPDWVVREAAQARQSRRAAEAKSALQRVVARLNGKPLPKSEQEPTAKAPNAWSAIVEKRNATHSGSSSEPKGAWGGAVAAFNAGRGG